MPELWKRVRLQEIAAVNPESLGGATPASVSFQYIDISCVERGKIDWQQVIATELRSPTSAKRAALHRV